MFAIYRNLCRPSKCVPLINVPKRTILPRRITGRVSLIGVVHCTGISSHHLPFALYALVAVIHDFARIKEDQAQLFAKTDRLKAGDWTLIYYSKKHYGNMKVVYGIFIFWLIPTFICFAYHIYNEAPHLKLLKRILDWPKILALIVMTGPFPFLFYYHWRNFVLRIYRHNKQPRKYAFVELDCFLRPSRPKIVMKESIVYRDLVQRNIFQNWCDGNFLVNGSKKMICDSFFNHNGEIGELIHF